MGEIKSVKVDNWGVFFLQKLQNFFNKTDYCDLTLQFRDNSQLKVHRLVLSACTDYFNVLEQTCEVIDDALIMPNELQADVVVPIVNFMYTGTLEFELKMYGKLLRTAKEMNMTVLLKLLEAHRRTMENVNRAQRPPSPKAIRRRIPVPGQSSTLQVYQTQGAQARRVLTTNAAGGVGGNANTLQRRIVQTKTAGTNVSPVQIQYRQQIGSTSVVRTSTLRATNPTQQHTLQSYIKNEPMEYETFESAGQAQSSSSPFEQLRKGYNNNKRPAVSTFLSPPAKKPNLEDVKEFAEQQRMRKQIAAEYGDDQEFEGMMDDDIHNDDDDDDALVGNPVQSSAVHSGNINTASSINQATASSVASATITIKPESDSQPPTIIVKDHSGSKMDHAKIISEVLRQYPQLAKGNKNIKLKIMPTGQGQAQRIVIKKEGGSGEQQQQQAMDSQSQHTQVETMQKSNQTQLRATPSHVITKTGERIPQQQFQQQGTVAKPNVVAVQQALVTTTTNAAAAAAAENTQQKRRIDSKTMHALIALGAENMTGPWLCLRCGLNGRPISIPSYRGFRRHLINTHKEAIDPALCEHCGWRSQNNRELHFHVQIEHKIKTTLYTFPECLLCAELFLDTNSLNQHMLDSHPSANKQQCVYCNKIFIKDMQLYTHLKLYHKHQAVEDGIIDVSDEEYTGSQGENAEAEEHLESEDHEDGEQKNKKVKILSDISLPMVSSVAKIEGTVIDAHTKFVTADGNEMLLTDEQRKEIMSQLNQDHNNGGVVMVLNDAIFPGGVVEGMEVANVQQENTVATEEPATIGAESVSGEEFDDSQIYAELASEKTESEKQQEETKEADESLKWAENLVSEHDLPENEAESGNDKKHEEDKAKNELISKKLKELTVDWSEDENEEDDTDIDKSGEPEESVTKSDTKTDQIQTEETEEANEEFKTEDIDANIKESEHTDLQDESALKKEDTSGDAAELQCAEKDHQEDHDLAENDELELAMQNLHDEGGVEDTENNTEIQLPIESEAVTKVEKADDSVDEENVAENKQTEENPENSLNSALLDELMSATAEQSAESSELETALKEASSKTPAIENNAEDELDAFEKAGLNDVEEFSALESSEPTKEAEATLSPPASLEATTAHVENVAEEIENTIKEEDIKLEDKPSTTLGETNASSSESEDVADDVNKDH